MSHSFPTLRSSYLLTVNEFTHHASRSYWSTSSQGPPLPWLITPAWLDCVGVVQPSPVQRLEMFMPAARLCSLDRKSVVSGKSVLVRVDLGGRRSIKKKI